MASELSRLYQYHSQQEELVLRLGLRRSQIDQINRYAREDSGDLPASVIQSLLEPGGSLNYSFLIRTRRALGREFNAARAKSRNDRNAYELALVNFYQSSWPIIEALNTRPECWGHRRASADRSDISGSSGAGLTAAARPVRPAITTATEQLLRDCEQQRSDYLVANVGMLGQAIRTMQISDDLDETSMSQLLDLVQDAERSRSISEQRVHLQALRSMMSYGRAGDSVSDLVAQINDALRQSDSNLRRCIEDGSRSLDPATVTRSSGEGVSAE
jgi:hypothetical protein